MQLLSDILFHVNFLFQFFLTNGESALISEPTYPEPAIYPRICDAKARNKQHN